MPDTAVTCRVCDSTDLVPWRERGLSRRLRPEDLQVTDHRYGVTLALVRCRACGFIFADDEEIEELTLLYEQLSDPEYEASAEARRLQMRWLLRTVRRVHPGVRTLLDIGAATGLLVEEAQAQGLEAVGVEPGVRFVEAALCRRGIQLVHGVFPHPSLAGRRFDLVFLVDVIEHVAEPVDLLRHCAGALAPRGLVVVVTPDVASLAARLLGRRWWHYHSPMSATSTGNLSPVPPPRSGFAISAGSPPAGSSRSITSRSAPRSTSLLPASTAWPPACRRSPGSTTR
jgi:SAM-dependent methyltransferase